MQFSSILAVLLFGMYAIHAQEPALRYTTNCSFNYQATTYTYSHEHDLKLDLYEPLNDTAEERACVILLHAGAFIKGSRNSDSTIVQLCRKFARMGYVAISADYRLSRQEVIRDTVLLQKAIMRAVLDAHEVIRFIHHDFYSTNKYRVSLQNIFIGGNSAGAIAAAQYAYLNRDAELNTTVNKMVMMYGGLYDNVDETGKEFKVAAVLSLAGAMQNVEWIEDHDVPLFMAHGLFDSTITGHCSEAQFAGIGDQNQSITLCGSIAMRTQCDRTKTDSKLLLLNGTHQPWIEHAALFDTVINRTAEFMHSYIDFGKVLNSTIDTKPQFNYIVYPKAIQLQNLNDFIQINIYNLHLQKIKALSKVEESEYLDLSELPSGMYFIQMVSANNENVCIRFVNQ